MDLTYNGIRTFFDEWSIGAGDSIRLRIDRGLEECTHFIVLLTESSIESSWVNAEIDAAFVKKIDGSAKLIPLRYNLGSDRLPPLLRPLHSPAIRDYEDDLNKLVGEIYGISREPPLGNRPDSTRPRLRSSSGLSIAAQQIVAFFAQTSEEGRDASPRVEARDLRDKTGLSKDDFEMAVDELEHRRVIETAGFRKDSIWPAAALFVKYDTEFMPWDTKEDAERILVELLNSETTQAGVFELAMNFGWEARRINPAIHYLVKKRAVMGNLKAITGGPFVAGVIHRNTSTQRFLRKLQERNERRSQRA